MLPLTHGWRASDTWDGRPFGRGRARRPGQASRRQPSSSETTARCIKLLIFTLNPFDYFNAAVKLESIFFLSLTESPLMAVSMILASLMVAKASPSNILAAAVE